MLPSPETNGATENGALVGRIDALVVLLRELDTRVSAAELATGDAKTAKELRRAVEALAKHDPKLEDRLTNRVDVLADRLATLATTVSTTASSLAARDGEMVGLRRELERGNAQIEALAAELGRAPGAGKDVAELRKAVNALAGDRPARGSDRTIDELGRKVEFLSERIDTLAPTVATTAAGLAGRDGELVALRRKIDDDRARIAQALAAVTAARSDGHDVERIDRVAQAVAEATSRIGATEGAVANLRAGLAHGNDRLDAAAVELREEVARIATKLGSLDELPRIETVRELERRLEAGSTTLAALANRLDALDATVGAAATANAAGEESVRALGRRFEEATTRVDHLVADLRLALETMPALATDPEGGLTELTDTIDDLTGRLELLERTSTKHSASASADTVSLERALAEAVERLTSLERDRGAAAAELAHTTSFWSSELEAFETRLAELAQAHVLTEDLRARVELHEQEPIALVEPAEVIARLDELARRLEPLEHVSETRAAPSSVTGDGRFRVEVRGLELRMEHAEAAARENREAVLTQLERLASRIDLRLQRLEPDQPGVDLMAVTSGARVVPIRNDDG